MDEDLIWVAGRAGQLVPLHRDHRFCGRCGALTEDHPQERAKICPACRLMNTPRCRRLSSWRCQGPSVASGARHAVSVEIYSVLAGFVEPGDPGGMRAAEVFEETGVRIQNIRTSQPALAVPIRSWWRSPPATWMARSA